MTDNDTTRVESLRDLIGQYDRNVAQNAATERRHPEGHDRGTKDASVAAQSGTNDCP